MRVRDRMCVAVLAAGLVAAAVNAGSNTGRAPTLNKPTENMSADDLMKIDYAIKYTTFLDDCCINKCAISYISRDGHIRQKEAKRFRITLNRPEDGLDYKDLVVITHPENVKGLAIMTWSYLDPARQRDQWLWLPSLKKARRTSPSEAEDAFMGSDFTIEDMTSREWEDETYEKLPDAPCPGYQKKPNGEVINKDTPCYVIECTPKKQPYYYSRRKVYLDKTTGANIFEEIYDPKGNLAQTIARVYENLPEGPIQTVLEAFTVKTGHATRIENSGYVVNSGLNESVFTEKSLMRTSW